MGVVTVNENDVPMACCFVYTTGTSLAEISWISSEKDLPFDQRLAAICESIRAIQKIAMKLEPQIRLIEIVTRDKSLEPVLKELGFWVKYGHLKATYMPPNE
jgi:hypothetical protein